MSSFSVNSSASLSESLVNPRRQVKRRTNEYVKERPQSREVLENERNQQNTRYKLGVYNRANTLLSSKT